uniref:Ovule protein n=1 Tax=Steinernema glaseri TaxID=37863 RepID=A0A1I7ZFU4_9BILA
MWTKIIIESKSRSLTYRHVPCFSLQFIRHSALRHQPFYAILFSSFAELEIDRYGKHLLSTCVAKTNLFCLLRMA